MRGAGVQTYEFPPSVWEALADATVEMHGARLSDPLYAEVYQSMLRSLRRTAGWAAATESAFRQHRNLVHG